MRLSGAAFPGTALQEPDALDCPGVNGSSRGRVPCPLHPSRPGAKPFRHSIAVFHGRHGPRGDLNNKITRKTYYRPWPCDRGDFVRVYRDGRLHSKRNRSPLRRSGFPSSSIHRPLARSRISFPRRRRREAVLPAPVRGKVSALTAARRHLHPRSRLRDRDYAVGA